MVRSYRYHATLAPVVVETEEQEAALGPGWFDSPDKALAYAPDPDAPPATLTDIKAVDALKLIAEADAATAQAWLDAELATPKPRAGITRVLGERLDALK